MKHDDKVKIAKRHVAEAEAAIVRQKRLIGELQNSGRSHKGSQILLSLFEDALRNAKDALAGMRFKGGEQ